MAEKNHRRCISCRQAAHRNTLWRIVRTFPDHQIQLDQGIGRSAYLCPRTHCLQSIQKKNRLGRALKAPIPPHIYEVLENRLYRASLKRCTESMHIAR